MSYKVELKAEIRVQFSQPDLAEEFFIGGDWSESFCDFAYLDQLSEYLAYNFHVFGTDLEGFAKFKREKDYFVSEAVEYGKIYLKYDQELEVDYVWENQADIVVD